MADRVKVYEEKKSGTPIWAWLLPLLLVLALLGYFLVRHNKTQETASAPLAQGAFPDLGVVHFDTDKATLTPDGTATLDKAVDALKANPKAHMRLEGYTDATGTAPHNADLSEQRAMTVADYLQSKGIERSRLTGGGFGPEKPVDTNATPTGKADNRRVELFTQN